METFRFPPRLIPVTPVSPGDRSFVNQVTMASTAIVTFMDKDLPFVNQDLSGMISDRSFVDKDLTAAQGILNFYLSIGSTFIKDIPLKQK